MPCFSYSSYVFYMCTLMCIFIFCTVVEPTYLNAYTLIWHTNTLKFDVSFLLTFLAVHNYFSVFFRILFILLTSDTFFHTSSQFCTSFRNNEQRTTSSVNIILHVLFFLIMSVQQFISIANMNGLRADLLLNRMVIANGSLQSTRYTSHVFPLSVLS